MFCTCFLVLSKFVFDTCISNKIIIKILVYQKKKKNAFLPYTDFLVNGIYNAGLKRSTHAHTYTSLIFVVFIFATQILPRRIDWTGQEHEQTYTELVSTSFLYYYYYCVSPTKHTHKWTCRHTFIRRRNISFF